MENYTSSKNILIVVQNIYAYSILTVITSLLLLLLPIILIVSIFDKNRKIISATLTVSSSVFLKLFIGFKVKTSGINILPPQKGERRIYVVNHASRFDGLLFSYIPGNIKTIMKASDAKIPVIGWIISMAGHVLAKKESNIGNKSDIVNQIITLQNKGNAILIFPEGTRSKNGKIGNFHNGGFKIALKTKSDIYPIVFDTWNVVRPGTFLIKNMTPQIKYLKPLKYNEIKNMSHIELSHLVKAQLTKELGSLHTETSIS